MENILYPLAFLACPAGMGLMMWFMMRGNKKSEGDKPTPSLAELRTEQRRIDAEIDRLDLIETDRLPADPR